MPLSLKHLRQAERGTSFQYDGETVNIVYRANMIGPITRIKLAAGDAYFKGVRNGEEEATTPDSWWRTPFEEISDYIQTLVDVLVSWDVLGDDGKPVPISFEFLGELPLSFLTALAGAVLLGESPNPTNGEGSSGPSSQED